MDISILKLAAASAMLLLLVTSVASAQQYNKVTYVHSDADGTPFAATDEQGNIEWKIDHYPYGDEYSNTEVARKSDISFAGKPFDQEIGLSYFGGRWYDPAIGRFTGIDPVSPLDYLNREVPNIFGFNRYVYANNNPYKYIDIDGREAVVIVDGSNINITVPIKYSGAGATPSVINRFNKGIENAWTGQFGRFNVTTTVTDRKTNGLLNEITVPEGGGRANVVNRRTGTWPTESTTGPVAGHEGGHLMGLPDRYNKKTGQPLPGYENNIMGRIGGRPENNDIIKIKHSETNKVIRKKDAE